MKNKKVKIDTTIELQETLSLLYAMITAGFKSSIDWDKFCEKAKQLSK